MVDGPAQQDDHDRGTEVDMDVVQYDWQGRLPVMVTAQPLRSGAILSTLRISRAREN
jgi:hypothetical protein